MAFAGDARVRIFEGADDARDAGGDQGVHARRRFSVMGAGFERDVGGGAAGGVTRVAQGFGFGVRAAALLGPAAADDGSLIDDDAADGRVRPDATQAPARQ